MGERQPGYVPSSEQGIPATEKEQTPDERLKAFCAEQLATLRPAIAKADEAIDFSWLADEAIQERIAQDPAIVDAEEAAFILRTAASEKSFETVITEEVESKRVALKNEREPKIQLTAKSPEATPTGDDVYDRELFELTKYISLLETTFSLAKRAWDERESNAGESE